MSIKLAEGHMDGIGDPEAKLALAVACSWTWS